MEAQRKIVFAREKEIGFDSQMSVVGYGTLDEVR